MHLNSQIALDLADGTLNRNDNQYWNDHLESCTECSSRLQVWKSLINSIAQAHIASAPEDVVASAKKVFRTPRTIEFRPPRKIIASMVFDSFAQPTTAAIRGETTAFSEQAVIRHVVFQAEQYDICVRLSMFDDHRDLLGQILPRDSRDFVTDTSLHLRQDDERIASAVVNELGEFQFCDVPDGKLSLQIDLPNMTIITALQETT
jgi:hypothetical protein